MKNVMTCVLAAMLMAASAVPCLAASSPWDGTWKQNQSKARLGDTFTVSRLPNGMLHFSDGSAIQYDYACDGKEYTALADRTQTCTGDEKSGFDYVIKAGGKLLETQHDTLSQDGKVLTSTGKQTRPDGTTVTSEVRFVRVAGTGGPTGTWKSVAAKSSAETILQLSVSEGTMHYRNLSYKEGFDGKLDGTAATVSGPTIPAGATTSMKAEGPLKVRYTDMLNGKTLWEGTMTVSPDGRTLTNEQWVPGKVAEKTTEVFEKQ